MDPYVRFYLICGLPTLPRSHGPLRDSTARFARPPEVWPRKSSRHRQLRHRRHFSPICGPPMSEQKTPVCPEISAHEIACSVARMGSRGHFYLVYGPPNARSASVLVAGGPSEATRTSAVTIGWEAGAISAPYMDLSCLIARERAALARGLGLSRQILLTVRIRW